MLHFLQFFQPFDRGANSTKIGQHTTQPAVIDKRHTTTLGFFPDRIARGTLGTNEQNLALFRSNLAQVINRILAQWHGLFEIDNMNFVALTEDKGSHFGVPETGLVTEMHARFQHFTHGDVRHKFLQMSVLSGRSSVEPPGVKPPHIRRLRPASLVKCRHP